MNRKAKTIELLQQGESTAQIACGACISPAYVSKIRCMLGKQTKHRKPKRNYLQTVELSELKL